MIIKRKEIILSDKKDIYIQMVVVLWQTNLEILKKKKNNN
jgi:hypothetical protein